MKQLRNKRIGITGGTGSFGSTFLKKLLVSNDYDNEVIVFSRDETKQENLRRALNDKRINFMIGDVRDINALNSFSKRVDVIFHAAAMKYVPVCEFNPYEGILTNIIGSENILKAADNNNVEKIVLLSTDKAVEPINAMGMTKALMEKLGIAKAIDCNYSTKVCITRYGNVLGSRGSVIPFFVERIKRGNTLPITDPEMTRFVMSLEESVKLVMYALEAGETGQLFVQKSPAARVDTIAKAILKLMKSDNEFVNIGVRHAEKKHEVLISSAEMERASENSDYFTIEPDKRDSNYERNQLIKTSKKASNYTSANTRQLDVDELMAYISNQEFWLKLVK